MTEMYSLIAEKTRSPQLRHGQGGFLLKTLREKLSHVSPLASSGYQQSFEFLARR